MLAAGDGRRAGGQTNKVLLPLAGRRVFTWSIRWARELAEVRRTVLVVREQDRESVDLALAREVGPPEVTVITGGDSRHESEWQALQALSASIEAGEIDVVLIHDAARPLASTALFADVIAAAATYGGAIPVRDQGNLVALDPHQPTPDSTADRIAAVQTPQAFRAAPLLDAYRAADADGFVGTDTASCMERYTDVPVRAVTGDAGNIKITFPEDLFLAERLLAKANWDLTAAVDRRPRQPGLRRAARRREVPG